MRQYQKKCGRCGGTGIYSDRCGGCFNCGGTRAFPGSGVVTVTVYTAEEKASRKLLFARASAAYRTVREAALAMRDAGELSVQDEWFADQGVSELREREPERFAKMLDSLDAGRVTDVVKALAAYCAAGYPLWYGKKEEEAA